MEDQIRENVGRSTWLTYINERQKEREREGERVFLSLSVFVLSSFLAVRRSRVTKKKLYPILSLGLFSRQSLSISLYRSGGKLGAYWRLRLGRSSASARLSRSSILAKRSMVFERDDWHREKTERLLVTRCVVDRGLRLIRVRQVIGS